MPFVSRHHLVLLVLTVLSPLATAQFPAAPPPGQGGPGFFTPSNAPGMLFVPRGRVPLSEFVDKHSSLTAVMHVEIGILDWIAAQSGGKVQVAVAQPSGQIAIVNATSVVGDTVTYTSSLVGDCVVVSNVLRHVLRSNTKHSISTHWDGTGMGTRSFGATDGIKLFDYDPVSGQEVKSGTTMNKDPLFPYTYRVDELHLFSDGSGDPVVENATSPDIERFIGETYATAAVTNLRAVALSDHVRSTTGWPVAHLNAGPAGSVLSSVQDGLPIFQVVHCHVVDIGAMYPDIVGDENSLGTFILPPGWTSAADVGTYPILFNGFYDIHASTFGGTGKAFFEAIGEVYDASGGSDRVVGVLWNGGGAAVTTTQHRSAYDNAAKLIADAAALLKADADSIVLTGGSRGGTTALCIGSNPRGAPYRAAYVDAGNAQTAIGQAILRYINPAYGLIQHSVEFSTGYKGSWRSGWVVPAGEPHAGVGRDDFVRSILFGTIDPVEIDEFFSADSALFRAGLAAADTKVILGMSTHDYSRPFVQMADYANNLDALTTVTVLCNVHYRFGHTSPPGVAPEHADLLQRVFIEKAGGTPLPLTNNPGGVEVRYWAPDPADPTQAVALDPAHVPAIVEMPVAVGSAQDFTVVVVGQPDALVEIFEAPMAAGWVPGAACCSALVCCTSTSGSCLALSNYPACFDAPPAPLLGAPRLSQGSVFGSFVLDVDQTANPLPLGYRWYEVYYGPEGGTQPQIGQGDLAFLLPIAPGTVPGFKQFLNPCDNTLDPYVPQLIYDQPLLRVVDCDTEIRSLTELSRTGGLAGDRLHLP